MGTATKRSERGAVRGWMLFMFFLLLAALALMLTAMLTTYLIEYDYTATKNGVTAKYASHYGIWEACIREEGLDYVCENSRDVQYPFNAIYSQTVRILVVVAVCLFLPSLVGVVAVAIQGDNIFLTFLCALTIAGSVGTGAAGFGLFTHHVETSDVIDTSSMSYEYSFFCAWIAIGILLIVLLCMPCLIFCQWKLQGLDEYEDEVRLQIKDPKDKGLYNPAYVLNYDMSRSTVKRGDQPLNRTSQAYDEDFHYRLDSKSFDNKTFMQYGNDNRKPAPVIQHYRYPNRPEIYDLPETVHAVDDRVPHPTNPQRYGNTIELKPRQIQPTPNFSDDNMQPDYPASPVTREPDSSPEPGAAPARTFTISRIQPNVPVTGTPLDIGDSYVVSLNE